MWSPLFLPLFLLSFQWGICFQRFPLSSGLCSRGDIWVNNWKCGLDILSQHLQTLSSTPFSSPINLRLLSISKPQLSFSNLPAVHSRELLLAVSFFISFPLMLFYIQQSFICFCLLPSTQILMPWQTCNCFCVFLPYQTHFGLCEATSSPLVLSSL